MYKFHIIIEFYILSSYNIQKVLVATYLKTAITLPKNIRTIKWAIFEWHNLQNLITKIMGIFQNWSFVNGTVNSCKKFLKCLANVCIITQKLHIKNLYVWCGATTLNFVGLRTYTIIMCSKLPYSLYVHPCVFTWGPVCSHQVALSCTVLYVWESVNSLHYVFI